MRPQRRRIVSNGKEKTCFQARKNNAFTVNVIIFLALHPFPK
ncbi:rCG24872 [Rattus norvegicus]|uniref:RCG24872 n=1 Tax=Rattus norvegicus TaxID=10116 RepID=A6JCL5_RAT|nr:rCG24872 [Rattus norvegicus]